MKEMKEIDLKKTPLSEIDLSRIDYEKSYVEYDGKINSIKTIKANFIEERWEVDCWWFTNQGKHIIRPSTVTLHLFYKEVKSCYMCRYLSGSRYVDPCYSCANIGRSDKDNWQPKESPKEARDCNTCKHLIVSRYFQPCRSCSQILMGGTKDKWTPAEQSVKNPHPIVIEYENLGDTVKITKIEGVMTVDEIKNHVGKKVLDDYFDGVHMSMNKGFLNVKDGLLWYFLPVLR